MPPICKVGMAGRHAGSLFGWLEGSGRKILVEAEALLTQASRLSGLDGQNAEDPASLSKCSFWTSTSTVRQPANKNVPTNPLLGGTVGSRGSSLMAATPKGDLTLSYLA